jgi:hypothetical protein
MKIIHYLIVGILVFSSFTIVSIGKETSYNEQFIDLEFSVPRITEENSYISLDLKGANTCINEPSKPIIPMCTKKYVFSFGTKIKDIEFDISEINSKILNGKIKPAPQHSTPSKNVNNKEIIIEDSIYKSEDLYPDDWFYYSIGAGLDENNEHKMFLTIQIFPVRYNPSENKIYYIEDVKLKIKYDEPEEDFFPTTSEYNLLILTPSKYTKQLDKLVNHKESYGIKTILVTLDEIYDGEYFQVEGRDDPEKIKYFIKNAIEEWGIEYVLLVGGRIPGIKEKWHFPVRYVHIYVWNEPTYVSDLYYADIYNGLGDFSTWDTNENGIYGEWYEFESLIDEMDLYPDVKIGRLTCRLKFELNIMINKIITYENSKISKRVVLSGGDNFDDIPFGGNNENEGELVCNKTMEYLPDFEKECVYTPQTEISSKNLRKALRKGAMFMHLHGHGSPLSWTTHEPLNFDEWVDGLYIYDLPLFFNKEYPIVVIGGCHTSMFNISMTIYSWSGPSFRGLSDWLIVKLRGGAIATLGYTCFPVATPGENGDIDGDGINEPDCVESGYGYMQLRFFYAYGEEDMQYLGDCWSFAVANYTDHFKIPYERAHLHTIHGFVLLGDPSLKIGGYEE